MSIRDAISSVYSNYATGSGRAPASEYWWYCLVNVVFYTIVWSGAFGLSLARYGTTENNPVMLGATVMVIIFFVVNIPPNIAVTVRRLHDVGLSGLFYFLNALPTIGSLILTIIMLLPGTRGDNRYGRDPREHGRARAWAPTSRSGLVDGRGAVPFTPRITPMVSVAPDAFATTPSYTPQAPAPTYTPQAPSPYGQQPPTPTFTPQAPMPTYTPQAPSPYGQQPPTPTFTPQTRMPTFTPQAPSPYGQQLPPMPTFTPQTRMPTFTPQAPSPYGQQLPPMPRTSRPTFMPQPSRPMYPPQPPRPMYTPQTPQHHGNQALEPASGEQIPPPPTRHPRL